MLVTVYNLIANRMISHDTYHELPAILTSFASASDGRGDAGVPKLPEEQVGRPSWTMGTEITSETTIKST